MIEVVRSELDARERYRWSVALHERPILVERPTRARGPQLVAAASTFLYLAMLVVIAASTEWGMLGEGAIGALAAGGIVLAGRIALWMWHEARSRWPSGRFLFHWGYVEVEHDRLRYVAGNEIEHALDEHAVTLRAGRWSTSFGVADADAIADALETVGAPRPAMVVNGYRDAPWVVRGADVGPRRLSPRATDFAWIVGVALLGAVAGHAARSARHAQEPLPRDASENRVAPTARMPSRVPWN